VGWGGVGWGGCLGYNMRKDSTLIGQSWAKPVTSTGRQRASQPVRDQEEGTGTLPPVTDQTRETPQKKEEEEKNKTPLDILQEKADRFQLEKERERDEEEERRKAPVGGKKRKKVRKKITKQNKKKSHSEMTSHCPFWFDFCSVGWLVVTTVGTTK